MNERKLNNYTVIGADPEGGDYWTDRVFVEHVKATTPQEATTGAIAHRWNVIGYSGEYTEDDFDIIEVFEGHLTGLLG